jgi:hypothetical protein
MKKITLFFLIIILAAFTVNSTTEKEHKDSILGTIKKVTIPVCRIDVGYDDSKSFDNVYAAPEGWQILSFKEIVVSKRQKASYSFDLTPSKFDFYSLTEIDKKFSELLAVDAKDGKKDYGGKIKQVRSAYEKYVKKIKTSHSSITTKGSVEGDGNVFKGYPGRLYLDLEVKLVYMPDKKNDFDKAIDDLKDQIEKDAKKKEPKKNNG